MKQLKFIQVPKQSHLLDKFISEKSIYSDRNFFLNQYRTINRLLKLNYTYYYKYNYNLYMFLKKFFYLNMWRFYLKPLSKFYIISPFYKFYPQIQLKDYLFYKNLPELNLIKKLYILNKKQFYITSYLKLYSRFFYKSLPGGLNSLFLYTNNSNEALPTIDQTSILLKKITQFECLQNTFLVFKILDFVFILALGNYMSFYNFIKCLVLVRL